MSRRFAASDQILLLIDELQQPLPDEGVVVHDEDPGLGRVGAGILGQARRGWSARGDISFGQATRQFPGGCVFRWLLRRFHLQKSWRFRP